MRQNRLRSAARRHHRVGTLRLGHYSGQPLHNHPYDHNKRKAAGTASTRCHPCLQSRYAGPGAVPAPTCTNKSPPDSPLVPVTNHRNRIPGPPEVLPRQSSGTMQQTHPSDPLGRAGLHSDTCRPPTDPAASRRRAPKTPAIPVPHGHTADGSITPARSRIDLGA